MIPPPRLDLRVTPVGAGLAVDDPVTGGRARLGPQSAAVWRALLDDHHHPATLIAAVPHLTPATIRDRLCQLDDALLLDGARFAAQRALFENAQPLPAAADLPLRLDPALRHQCVRCGASCTGVHVGPVPDTTRAAVERLGLWRAVPGAEAPDDAFVRGQGPDGPWAMMRRVGEACFALTADAACGLHAALGPAAKPPICRQFPYTFTRGPDAVHVGLQMECARFEATLPAGAERPVEAVEAELTALVGEGAEVFDLPDPVPVAAGLWMSRAEYLKRHAWFARALAWPPYGPGFRGLTQLIVDRVQRRLPPDAWRALAYWPGADDPDPRSAQDRLAVALRDLLGRLAEAADLGGRAVEAEATAAAREVIDLGRLGWLETSMFWAGADACRLWNLPWHAAVREHGFVRQRDLAAGFGRIDLMVCLAQDITRARVPSAPSAQDANDGLRLASRVLRMAPVDALLREHAYVLRTAVLGGDVPSIEAGPWLGVPP